MYIMSNNRSAMLERKFVGQQIRMKQNHNVRKDICVLTFTGNLKYTIKGDCITIQWKTIRGLIEDMCTLHECRFMYWTFERA